MEQSFSSLATDILNYNKNILELLNKLQTIATSTQESVTMVFSDGNTDLNITMPSIGYLESQIQRLNNTLKSIYTMNGNTSYIQSDNSNSFRKIILVNLNIEPKVVGELNVINTFYKSNNNFFDGLLDPMLSVNISLKNKIDNNVRKVLTRRYIINFDLNSDGTLTTTATNALTSFDTTFKSKNNILHADFIKWYSTIGGVMNSNNPYYDENMIDTEPNMLLYRGFFSVDKIVEDDINQKVWYYLDKLEYYNNSDNSLVSLKLDDTVLLNNEFSNSRYKVVEISYESSTPKVRFQQIEGIESIPVLKSALKINSIIDYTQTIKVSIGFNERCIIFVKPFDTTSNILANDWSLGTGFYTNDLNLTSNDSENGKNMQTFYSETVNDYGQVLSDLVKKKIPVNQGVVPNKPILNPDNFKVVQVNKHITETNSSKELAKKYAYQKELQSEINQLNLVLSDKRKNVASVNLNDISKLINIIDVKNNTYQTAISDTINISKEVAKLELPVYKVRAFWDFPQSINGQEVIQFYIEYKSVSNDNSEIPNTSFKLTDKNAIFSNWIPLKTDVRKRIYDPKKNVYVWEVQDVSDADTPNINQLEVPININETLIFRIKSISEIGYPDSILESEWSDTVTVTFPTNLSNVIDSSSYILQAASQDELVVKMKNELNEVITHVDDSVIVNNTKYLHKPTSILSGFKDSNSNELNLYEYLKYLSDTIFTLQEKINKSLGVLTISIFRSGVETVVKSDTEFNFNIECEDYLTKYTGNTNGKSGRIYDNNIYTIKDFYLKIKNSSVDSPLSILTNRSNNYNGFYSNDVPQNFWVNERDELLFVNTSGSTNTQINNQFLWQVNYIEKTENTTVNTSVDIKNNFAQNNSNSIVESLSNLQHNIGYATNDMLTFYNYNNSLMDYDKWCETQPTIVSNTKLLTTVHPTVQNLEYLVNRTDDLSKVINPQDSVNIPLNIYFKMNSINPNSGDGLNYDYIDLNNVTTTVKHVKRVKFYLENKADNKPYIFTIKFTINRNKVSVGRFISEPSLYMASGDVNAIKTTG